MSTTPTDDRDLSGPWCCDTCRRLAEAANPMTVMPTLDAAEPRELLVPLDGDQIAIREVTR